MSKSSLQRRQEKRDREKERKLTALPFPGSDKGATQWLINTYVKSHDYRQLSLDTKKIYYRALKRLGEIAPSPAIELCQSAIHRELTQMPPGMAAQFISVGSVFYNWLGITNPFEKLKKPKCGEWEAWTIDDVMRATRGLHPARVELKVLFFAAFAGLRLSDIQKLEMPERLSAEDILERGVILKYTQGKTKEEMLVPIPGPLFSYYAKMCRPDYPEINFVQNMRLDEVGPIFADTDVRYHARTLSQTVGKPFHGLRKTCSWLLAEGECSVHEIAAVTGHRTMTMLARYTRLAEKRRLAQSALIKMTRRLNEAKPGGSGEIRQD